MELQRYEVPSVLGTTYVYTDNPPAGASLVQDNQAQPPVSKPSLEQRIEVLEKAVSNINERLGIQTDSSSVDTDAASELLDSLDSSAATKATKGLANSGVSTAAAATTTPTDPSSSEIAPIPMDPSSLASASAPSSTTPTDPSSSASAPIPSADDIAKQLGDLT